jgi:hypothetical protein
MTKDRDPRRADVPVDAPEADVAEQKRGWTEDEEERTTIPPDAPEADVLEQSRSADLDDDEWDRGG